MDTVRTTMKETLYRYLRVQYHVLTSVEYSTKSCFTARDSQVHQNPSSPRVIRTILKNSFSLYRKADFSNPLVEDYEFSLAAVLSKNPLPNLSTCNMKAIPG